VCDSKRVFPILSQGVMRGKTFRVPHGEQLQQICHAPEFACKRRSPGQLLGREWHVVERAMSCSVPSQASVALLAAGRDGALLIKFGP
jgi:hypothetical protein